MALYGTYTPKQQEVLNMLTKEASFYKRKWDEAKQKLMNKPLLNFEENRITRKKAREFHEKYENLTAQINDVLQAKDEYEYCLKKCKSYLDRAETLKETWGFTEQDV